MHHKKLNPPLEWRLTSLDNIFYKWQMLQENGDLIYKREWYARYEFESWLHDRYRKAFVTEVMKLWP